MPSSGSSRTLRKTRFVGSTITQEYLANPKTNDAGGADYLDALRQIPYHPQRRQQEQPSDRLPFEGEPSADNHQELADYQSASSTIP